MTGESIPANRGVVQAATESGDFVAPASGAGRVILLNVDLDVRHLLSGKEGAQLTFDDMASAGQLFVELEQMKCHVDAMLLGVKLKEPVRIAQRIHSMGRDIPLLILTEPERYEQLRQALKFAPFLGNYVMPWSTGELDKLPGILLETVIRTQKRRAYRGSIAAAQKRLGDVQRERPQVTHYLDRLLDHAPIGVLNIDVQGTVLGLNRRAGQILRLTEREVLGTSLFDAFPEPDRENLRNMIAQCVAPTRMRLPKVFDISSSVGSVCYIEVMASSLVDRSGQLGATVILQDVTARVRAEQERREAEEALRISERRYRELVQTMSEALALTDEQHFITYVNESFCRMFGYASDEVIGKNLLNFVHQDDYDIMRQRMSKPVRISGVQRYETAWVTKQGEKIYTLTSPKRIFDSDNEYVGCLGVFTDITERKQVEEREKQHMVELAHVSRVTTIGEMSSQIAHELAQPLTAIAGLSTGCVRMLRAGTGDQAEILESLTDINQQANRAREIVVRLRNFVRNEEMRYARIELNELVRTVVNLVEVEARWNQLPVSLQLSEPLPATRGDRILIEQVVLNLVRNGIEAMHQTEKERRQLTIRTSNPEPDKLLVEVTDTGSGITEANLKQIFEPFFTTKSDGMGMGLVISRSIIDAHGGRLSARSNKRGGATFSFTLPTEDDDSDHAIS